MEMESATVVLYPSPEIGHLVSMVELGKLIHTHLPSLSITVLVIPAPYETGSTTKYINTVSTTTSITFHHLPPVTLPPHLISCQHIDLAIGITELYNPILHETLLAISHKSTIKAVILDIFSSAAFQVFKTLDLPTYYFNTGSAFALCMFLYLPNIHTTTSNNIKDADTYFTIPGMPPIHPSDIPTVLLDRESQTYKFFIKTARNMAKSSGVIVNSFVEFERTTVDNLRDGRCVPDGPTPPIYLVGPLTVDGNQVDHVENECLKWLNSQPSKSVVFLCFGSRGVFKKDQLKEIASGLEKSGQRFLWVVRNPPPDDDDNEPVSGTKELDLEAILPEGFLARTGDKGLVVKNWAPQTAILNHQSVGGFVSHCGWNSTLEAVVAGIPMVAWPLYAEQKMNRVSLVEEAKVAVAVKMLADGFVTAETVEEKVRELMEGEEGKVVRGRILDMRRRAKAAGDDGGSSRVEFIKLTGSWSTM